ncbi:CHAP domain-containing protein [Flavimobilis marinus]|nr:CHAP domain-containing protein [Flavimobilis marinus]
MVLRFVPIVQVLVTATSALALVLPAALPAPVGGLGAAQHASATGVHAGGAPRGGAVSARGDLGGASPTASARPRLSISVSRADVRKGERIWIAGRLSAPGAVAGRTVHVDRRKVGTPTWKRYTSDRANGSGKYVVTVRPTAVYEYRARVTAASGSAAATSASRTVRFSTGTRTLAARAALLGSKVGRATGRATSLSRAQVRRADRAGLRSVTSRSYERGLLVKVRTSSATRTWLVSGDIRRAYEAAGGPAGRYGVPLHDAKCGLLEKGCVQRFSRGTLYESADRSRATATTVTGRRGEVIAAARSQVGYRYRYADASAQRTKFNTWMGNRNAWCSFLQSWASAASGNGALIPKEPRFSSFVSTVRAQMRTGSRPKVGALVFFNTYAPAGRITHVGLVTAVGRSTITVIDGNTTGNLPASTRGVLEREWPRSRALLYAYPEY